MAFSGAEKAFCVLQFAKSKSIVMVQRRFRTQYHKDPPTDKPIHTWYNNFEQIGSFSAGKRTGRPSVSDVYAEHSLGACKSQHIVQNRSCRFHIKLSGVSYINDFNKTILEAATAGIESPGSRSSLTVLRTYSRGTRGVL